MATSVRKLPIVEAQRAIDVLNQMRLDLLKLRSGTIYHATQSTAVDGYGTLSQVDATNALVAAYNTHIASVCDSTTGEGCHLSADSSNAVTSPVATDTTSAITRANELKADFNLHRASTTFHPVADSVHVVTAADATNSSTLNTLLSDLQTQINAHFAGGFTATATTLVDP